jgi:hypothetical protein
VSAPKRDSARHDGGVARSAGAGEGDGGDGDAGGVPPAVSLCGAGLASLRGANIHAGVRKLDVSGNKLKRLKALGDCAELRVVNAAHNELR